MWVGEGVGEGGAVTWVEGEIGVGEGVEGGAVTWVEGEIGVGEGVGEGGAVAWVVVFAVGGAVGGDETEI